jgi:hypothetical protein
MSLVEGASEPLTARQHERVGRRNKRGLSCGILREEISIERAVEAKLAAQWQSAADLRRGSAMMASEEGRGVRTTFSQGPRRAGV